MQLVAGDRIYHRSMGPGTVQRCEKGDVHVIFDKTDKRGVNAVGIYDENWFRINGSLMEKLPREKTSG